VEISRLRAAGIAVRSAGMAFLLASGVALVELAVGHHRIMAACCAVAFFAGFVSATRAGGELSRWAGIKTLEVAFWLPDIETALAARTPAPRPEPSPAPPAQPGSS
jgi:hypothetical protein